MNCKNTIIIKPIEFDFKLMAYEYMISLKNVCTSTYVYIYETYTSVSKYIDNKLREKYRVYDNDAFLCNICMEGKKDTVLIPCGHTLCKKCQTKIQECAICRSKINGQMNVYI